MKIEINNIYNIGNEVCYLEEHKVKRGTIKNIIVKFDVLRNESNVCYTLKDNHSLFSEDELYFDNTTLADILNKI